MTVDFDAKLTDLAADILRDAVDGLDLGDAERWPGGNKSFITGQVSMFADGMRVTGAFPAVTGSFSTVTGSFPALSGAFAAIGAGEAENRTACLKKVFGLPRRLPAMRLPSTAQLAAQARSAPIMEKLEALARWLGQNGRTVTAKDELSEADAADAARSVGVSPGYLPYLWEYALTTGWFDLHDEPDGGRTWVTLGKTAWRWVDRDDAGTLCVWSVVFAAVLVQALEVAAFWDQGSPRNLRFEGHGVVVAIMLLLAGRAGLSPAEITKLIMSGAIGDRPSKRSRRAWDGWIREHGDPALLLLNELAALHAVTMPQASETAVRLAPLSLWSLREQVRRDGVKVPLLPPVAAQMKAVHLVAMAESLGADELEAEFVAWVAGRGPESAASELLVFAAFSDAKSRLVAVSLTRGIGFAAHGAWEEAMQRPELRGYARIALFGMAAQRAERALPPVLAPNPDELTRVAADLLGLACGDKDPDPEQIAKQFSEAVPQGAELWILELMSRSSGSEVDKVLTALGRYHPERWVAKAARKAGRAATRSRTGTHAARVQASAAGR